jgi:hypothetical protein
LGRGRVRVESPLPYCIDTEAAETLLTASYGRSGRGEERGAAMGA